LRQLLDLFGRNQRYAPRSKRQFKTKEIEEIIVEQKRREKSGEALLTASQVSEFLARDHSEKVVAPSTVSSDVNLEEEDAAKYLLGLVNESSVEEQSEAFAVPQDDIDEPAEEEDVGNTNGDNPKGTELPPADGENNVNRGNFEHSPEPNQVSGTTSEDLLERIENGRKDLSNLSPEEEGNLRDMALWFVNWDTAYKAARRVWDIIASNPQFPVNVLLGMVHLTFADFLLEVLCDLSRESSFV
jgi:hypothetical protein